MSRGLRSKLLSRAYALALCLILSSCATMSPPQPPSLELPKPPLDLRAVRKGDKALLSWTRPTVTTDRQKIKIPGSVLICRSFAPALSECGIPVGRATPSVVATGTPSSQPKITDSYTDVLTTLIPSAASSTSNAAGFATYAVEALNPNGHAAGLSNQVQVPLAETLPPPQDFAAKVSGQGVLLMWTGAKLPQKPETTERYLYRVYRRVEGDKQPLLIGEVPADRAERLSLSDSNIEWERTYFYHAEAVTVLDQRGKPELQIEGDDTAEIKVFTHDIFPPAVPSGVQAAFSGPGQELFIDVIWAPVTDADLAGYNVYRREENGAAIRINAELVKTPAYRDTKVAAGKTYFYSVSSVDVRGNESARSEEASESVPAN